MGKKKGWLTEDVSNNTLLVQDANTIVSKNIIVNMLWVTKNVMRKYKFELKYESIKIA